MPIIRRKLEATDVYPDDIRYDPDTDTVQSKIGDDWVDNPDADPRTQTTLPARITSDPACDAAESVKDAFKGQIDGVLDAIDGAATAFTIAGIILGLFTFGVFEIFIALALTIANVMLDAGTSAINAALTDPVWETFKCILFCHFLPSGRLESGAVPVMQGEVEDQIGGLGAIILNAMLGLAGEGGINNLAALGTSTGDCSGCDCEPPCENLDWTLQFGTTYDGIIDGYHHFNSGAIGEGVGDSFARIGILWPDPDTCCYLTFIDSDGGGSGFANWIDCGDPQDGGHLHTSDSFPLPLCINYMAMKVNGSTFSINIKLRVCPE